MKFIPPSSKISSQNEPGIPTSEKGQDTADNRFLNPGGFYFGGPDCQIHTLLGSCIAVTLWHPKLHIGGMCHFVLPDSGQVKKQDFDISLLNGRYLDDAMLMFDHAAKERMTQLQEYQAKIFGGSNMLISTKLSQDDLIGTKNIEAALKYLSDRGIPLFVANVGESGHRRIIFDVASGDVWVKHEPLLQLPPFK